MADMADGEHATNGHNTTPANTDAQGNAQPGPLPLTGVAPDDNGPVRKPLVGKNKARAQTSDNEHVIDKGLKSLSVPKKNTPPKLMPHVDSSHDDIPAKGKELQGHNGPPSNLGALVRNVGGTEKMVILLNVRINYLESVESSQIPQRRLKDITQKIEIFVRKHGRFTSDEVISEEKDLPFLWHLRDDILNIQEFDAKKDTAPRFLSNSTPGGGVPPDPVLEALVAAPLSYRRRASANDIPARIPHR